MARYIGAEYASIKNEGYKAASKRFTAETNPYDAADFRNAWKKGWDDYHKEMGTDGDAHLTQAQNKMWS